MSTADPKPRKHKQKESKTQLANGAERLKTVVRRLPPNLPEDVFWQSVQAWVTDETVTWKSYHQGKLRTKRVNKEGIPSRAYIAFKNETLVATFSRAYDGHVFRDKTGNESHAVVEYAPFQKTPTEKKRTDARNNTIDKDDDYLEFLEALNKGGTKTESLSLEALISASQLPPPPTTTPLLEALKAEKSAQKDKEAILRNHAHYKDAGVSGSASKKEEGKKKAGAGAAATAVMQQAKAETQAQAQPPAPTPTTTMGKKAKKAAMAQQKAGVGVAQQAQEGQAAGGKGGPSAGVGVGAGGAPALVSVKPATATARHRPPKEPHGRSHPGKGDTLLAPASGPSLAQLPIMMTEAATSSSAAPSTGGPVPVQGQRKNRPVVGLGRHFEAALSGAGVAVSQTGGSGPGDRKRREKGGGQLGSAGTSVGLAIESGPTGKGGKQKHREERARPLPVEVVPSILQRPVEGGSFSTGPGAEVVIMQRPQSAEGGMVAGAGVGADMGAGVSASPAPGPGGRGFPRRGRGIRGRLGGHRGG